MLAVCKQRRGKNNCECVYSSYETLHYEKKYTGNGEGIGDMGGLRPTKTLI